MLSVTYKTFMLSVVVLSVVVMNVVVVMMFVVMQSVVVPTPSLARLVNKWLAVMHALAYKTVIKLRS
jgi:hypothetical protein